MDLIKVIKVLFQFVKSLPSLGKALAIGAIILALIVAIFFGSSCTSYRNVSLSVDKADNVSINVTDSVSSVYPNI